MKLEVIKSESIAQPWYNDGLRFTCSQCGDCCTGGPGFVWIDDQEIGRLAEYLKTSVQEVKDQYCRVVAGRLSLNENRNPVTGGYDCVFLKEENGRRICSAYGARPLQCRTWPFWTGNLQSPTAWQRANARCRGINHGRLFKTQEIESLRDARDWPDDAPGSS